MDVFLALHVIININGIRQVIVREVDPLSLDQLKPGIQSRLFQSNILQGVQRFTDLLNTVSVLVPGCAIFSLVCKRVVLPSLLDGVLGIAWILIN